MPITPKFVTISNGNDSVVIDKIIPCDANGEPTGIASAVPATWVNGATAQDFRTFGTVELQVASLSGGDTIAVTRSIDGANYVAQSYVASDFSTGATISANGIYSYPGGGSLKWTKTGAASSPTVTVRSGP